MPDRIKITIVDEQPQFREGIISILKGYGKFTILSESNSGKKFLKSLKQEIPDVVWIDLVHGYQPTVDYLQKRYPAIKILTPDYKDEQMHEYMRMRAALHSGIENAPGIDRYVTRTVKALADYINDLIIKPRILDLFNSRLKRPVFEKSPISNREEQVVSLITLGYTSKEMEYIMDVMPSTIKTLKKRILKKLKARTKADIIAYGLKHNLDKKFGYSPKKP